MRALPAQSRGGDRGSFDHQQRPARRRWM